jgi:transcriptional regulator with XRE-family HTH domain
MHSLVSMQIHEDTVRLPILRPREHSHEPDRGRKSATYVGLVTHPAAKRARFGQWVERALVGARAQGMTNKQVARAVGIAPSTFYHWQNGTVVPRFATLEKFCATLGLSVDEALATLRGDVRQPTAPEPAIHPEVMKLLRKMADPNVSAETKAHILGTLRYLNDLPEPKRRRKAS